MRRVLAAAALLVLATGCGGDEPSDLPPVSGGTPEQGALVRSIVEGLAPTEIQKVRILAPDPAGTPLGIDAAELKITPRPRAQSSRRAHWEELLIAGAFRDWSAEEGLMKVIAVEGVQGGALIDLRGRKPTSPARPAPAAERMSIARMVSARAQRQGATVEHLDVVSPYGPAVVLIVRVDDAAAFLRDRFLPMVERWWATPRLEGSYVVVRDRDGSVVKEAWSASRLTAASYYVRPDLAGCDPNVLRFAVPNASRRRAPPPCPAGGAMRG
jgi:hypothetical protein